MIPAIDEEFTEDLEEEDIVEENLIDFQMIRTENRLSGYVKEIEAVKQWIYKVLNTERYEYPIYSWDYGVEFSDLVGMPVSYVCPEIKRRIIDALTPDERITDVYDFHFDTAERGIVKVMFSVSTIYGKTEEETEVSYV